jgi:hypothetical protein
VSRGLLVPRIDHANAGVEAGLIDGVDVTSTQTEDALHALAFQGIYHQTPAVDFRH